MANVQIFKNPEYGRVRGFISSDNLVYINVNDIAHGLGFINKKGNPRLNTINKILKTFDFGRNVEGDDFIPENMFYLLAMKADNQAAKGFQKYLAYDVIPSIRKTGSYSIGQNFSTSELPSPSIRQSNINTRKRFTSTLQIFINYAKKQGDTRQPEQIYSKFTTIANNFAGIPKGERPVSNDPKQEKCKFIESLMEEIFLNGMDENKKYWRIESEVTKKANDFLEVSSPSFTLLEERYE